VLFEKSYGLADMEWNVPNTAESKFPDRLCNKAVHGGLYPTA
jgi:hypothetical protein